MAGNTEALDYGATGQAIYALIRSRATGQFWNGLTLENYAGANYVNYDVMMPESGTSRIYVFTCPPSLPIGDFDFLVRLRVGAVVAESDIPVSEISDHWDGSTLTPIGGGGGAALLSRYDRYPTAEDLRAFVADAGLTVPTTDLDISMQAGIQDLEDRCMRHFLAGYAIDNTLQPAAGRSYDPPTGHVWRDYGAFLDLGSFGDLARLDSVIYMPTSANPQNMVSGQQYRPLPQNAAQRGIAYHTLQFLSTWWSPIPQSQWGSIQVTGLWGYAMRIAPDMWSAFLANASLILFSSRFRGAGVPLGIKSWKGPEGISKEYDASMLTARLKQWQDTVTNSATQNGRWSFA